MQGHLQFIAQVSVEWAKRRLTSKAQSHTVLLRFFFSLGRKESVFVYQLQGDCDGLESDEGASAALDRVWQPGAPLYAPRSREGLLSVIYPQPVLLPMGNDLLWVTPS